MLFSLSSVLCASGGGLSAVCLCFAECVLLIPLLAGRAGTGRASVFLRLLFASSFVLRVYGLLFCAASLFTGWRAAAFFFASLALAVGQVSPKGAGRGRFAAIPLAFSVLLLCCAPLLGGNLSFPAWFPEKPSAPALLASAVCPVSAAFLPRNVRPAGAKRLLLLLPVLLGALAALPALIFRGVFGAEAALLLSAPFCAGAELIQVVYGAGGGAYTVSG